MDKKQRIEFLVRKNQGKIYKRKYIEEINSLLIISISEESIISLAATDEIKNILIQKKTEIIFDKSIPFNDKGQLRKFFIDYQSFFKNGVYLFTEYSEYCGAVLIDDINIFNIDFEFNAEHSGLVSFISHNLENICVLDFFEENAKYYLQITLEKEIK